ncbi:MAG: hypothetical protein IPL56_14600 [Saprospiraceae bacterium]|nr:hypothetical protein [Saprospiraceae bacterium]
MHWLSYWNDLLRNDYSGPGFITEGRKQITSWLYHSLKNDSTYISMVKDLIHPNPGSEGFIKGIAWRGEVNSSQLNRNAGCTKCITKPFWASTSNVHPVTIVL